MAQGNRSIKLKPGKSRAAALTTTHPERALRQLSARAQKMGMKLIAAEQPA